MCKACDWKNLVLEIDNMRLSERFLFADDTLSGIAQNCVKREHCTVNQRRAVYNIRDGSGPLHHKKPARIKRITITRQGQTTTSEN